MKTNNSILIVEDDNDVRETLAEILVYYGIVVHQACHGKDALETLSKIPIPALIILDAMMPVMDGPAFYAELRKEEKFGSVPVVLFSAVADKYNLEGLAGHLKKPADMDALLGHISKYCPMATAV